MPTEWFNGSLHIPTGFTSGEAVVMPTLFYADLSATAGAIEIPTGIVLTPGDYTLRSPVLGDSPVTVTDVDAYTTGATTFTTARYTRNGPWKR